VDDTHKSYVTQTDGATMGLQLRWAEQRQDTNARTNWVITQLRRMSRL